MSDSEPKNPPTTLTVDELVHRGIDIRDAFGRYPGDEGYILPSEAEVENHQEWCRTEAKRIAAEHQKRADMQRSLMVQFGTHPRWLTMVRDVMVDNGLVVAGTDILAPEVKAQAQQLVGLVGGAAAVRTMVENAIALDALREYAAFGAVEGSLTPGSQA